MSQGAAFLVPELFIHGRGFFTDASGSAISFVVLRLLLLGLFFGYAAYQLRKKFFSFPKQFWYLIIAAIVLSFLAKMFAFQLFFPSRYWRYTFPLIFVLFLGITASRMQGRRFISLFVAYLLVFFLVPMIQLGHATLDNTPCREQSGLHGFLQGLPVDAVVAGYPYDMDCVPAFTSRTAYLTFEHSYPLYSEYYNTIRDRTFALFDVYYASEDVLDAFCSVEGVDYFVYSKTRFSDSYLDAEEFYFKPYNSYVAGVVSRNRGNFSYSSYDAVYEDDEFRVVRCG